MADEVAVKDSILNSTKKNLGLDASYDAFDLDVITQINNAFFSLRQLGVGPASGFFVEDETDTWDDFVEEPILKHAVRNYVYLKTRSFFDPPGTPHHIAAMKEQIEELEHRMKTEKVIARDPLNYLPGV